MREASIKLRRVARAALMLALLTTPGAPGRQPLSGEAPEAGGFRWPGPDGEPLSFTAEEAALDFLRRAPVVDSRPISKGIGKARKLTLELEGVRAHAIFRTLDTEHRESGAPPWDSVRDSYVFEVAAYELSRLLHLPWVPPAVLREIDGEAGSLQLWVEDARTEADRMHSGEPPPDRVAWLEQKAIMAVFDNLIYNFDRHANNVLIDRQGRLWLVDHTRSFPRISRLPAAAEVSRCEASLYARLRDLDHQTLRKRLRPFLHKAQIAALFHRRIILVGHLDRLIQERGREAVLFESDV